MFNRYKKKTIDESKLESIVIVLVRDFIFVPFAKQIEVHVFLMVQKIIIRDKEKPII